MPEWILVALALGGLSLLGLLWMPLLVLCLPLFVLAGAVVPAEALLAASRAEFPGRSPRERWKRRGLTALLNVMQPLARLRGRLDHGLTPWRRRGKGAAALPVPRVLTVWSEHWLSADDRLSIAEEGLRAEGAAVEVGGEFDRWDLEARGGFFGCARLRLAVEEHGGGRQLARFRIWPRLAPAGLLLLLASMAAATAAALSGAPVIAATFGAVALVLSVRLVLGTCEATGSLRRAVERQAALARYELENDPARRTHEAHVAQGA
jgi:hypothetical protein